MVDFAYNCGDICCRRDDLFDVEKIGALNYGKNGMPLVSNGDRLG